MKKIIVSSLAAAAIIFSGCSDEKKTQTQEVVTQEKAVQVEVTQEATPVQKQETSSEIINQASKDVAKTVTEATNKVIENIKNDETTQKVVETTKEVVNETVQKAEKIVDETVKTVAPAVQKAIDNISASSSIDGKQLYSTCASCHGANAEKKALNMSQVIAGWDKQKLIDALNGYKNGTYGGPMKGVMLGQVSNKTPEEIEALATFISGL